MEKEQLVSVILPIYNVEKYLDRCIKSIVNQTYHNLEILLIDDGSSDSSPDICEAWAKKEQRIKVIHKKNAGLGMARNTGIENASGKYVFFVDSDDYVCTDMIEKAVRLAQKTYADIVCYGFSLLDASGSTRKKFIPQTKKTVYINEEIQKEFLANLIAPDSISGEKTNLSMSAWATMVSNELIKKTEWRFVSEREYISEDIYSLLILYKHASRVAVLPEPLYFYCENSGSLTQTFKAERYNRIIRFYYDAQNLCDSLGYSENVKKRLDYRFISDTIATLKIMCGSNLAHAEKRCELKKIVLNQDLQSMLKKNQYFRADSISRKTIVYLMKLKLCFVCYLLVNLQIKKQSA